MALKYTITHNGSTWNSSTDLDTISLTNGSTTSSITTAGTRTLNCAGKYMPNNLVIGDKTLNCANKIMTGNVGIVAEEAAYQGLTFTANTAGSTISISVIGTPTLGQNFQYKLDGGTWTTFTPGTTTVTLTNAGDKVYFRGSNPNGVSESVSDYYRFTMSGSIAGSGNIMSLIDNGACNTLVIPNAYCFNGLFSMCSALTTAPALPATTLSRGCYQSMFTFCTSLTTAPALPATTLSRDCYYQMFSMCSALTTAPALPATHLSSMCYDSMFSGCTSLHVYSASGTGHTNAWRIPTSGDALYYTSQDSMFYNTVGSYKSSSSVELNTTFYTQNTPV